MTTSDVLYAGAKYIRDVGWIQGKTYFIDANGTRIGCALGTIAICAHKGTYELADWLKAPVTSRLEFEMLRTQANYALADAIHGAPDYGVSPATVIAHWNDDRTQTRENVATTFELAAVLAEQHEKEAQSEAVAVTAGG